MFQTLLQSVNSIPVAGGQSLSGGQGSRLAMLTYAICQNMVFFTRTEENYSLKMWSVFFLLPLVVVVVVWRDVTRH